MVSRPAEPTSDALVQIRGETVALLPESAAFWVEAATLLVADTHFGKASTFRTAGVPVPRGSTREALSRLDRAILRTGARRVLFLGDFLHAATGRTPGTFAVLEEWRHSRPELNLGLVRGNHDRHAGDPPTQLGIECFDAPLLDGPFAFAHHPAEAPPRFLFAGHLHPAVRLIGPARQRTRLPCFWIGRAVAVLPAFGAFTGASVIRPLPGDGVWVIVDDQVVAIE